MNKKIIATAVAAMSLVSGIGFSTMNSTPAYAAKTTYKYTKRFYKVRITKKTLVYRINRNKRPFTFTKAYYLKPGQTTYIRSKADISWGWTIGKKYKYCSTRDANDYSWFTTKLKKSKAKTKPSVAVKHPKLTTKSTVNTQKSPADSAASMNALSPEEIQFFKSSSTPLLAKSKRALSYTGSKKKAADYLLMQQLNLVNDSNQPEISNSQFENQLNKVTSAANNLQNWINK